MQEIKYKTYTKNQMLQIIHKESFVFVENNMGDNFIIRMRDIADFIMIESIRTGYIAEITMYIPGWNTPVLTTYGCYLNRVNPLLREEIIERLVLLQTTNTEPKKVKVFDNDMFIGLSSKEKGIENGKVKNFNRFYRKYVYAQNSHNIKMEGDK